MKDVRDNLVPKRQCNAAASREPPLGPRQRSLTNRCDSRVSALPSAWPKHPPACRPNLRPARRALPDDIDLDSLHLRCGRAEAGQESNLGGVEPHADPRDLIGGRHAGGIDQISGAREVDLRHRMKFLRLHARGTDAGKPLRDGGSPRQRDQHIRIIAAHAPALHKDVDGCGLRVARSRRIGEMVVNPVAQSRDPGAACAVTEFSGHRALQFIRLAIPLLHQVPDHIARKLMDRHRIEQRDVQRRTIDVDVRGLAAQKPAIHPQQRPFAHPGLCRNGRYFGRWAGIVIFRSHHLIGQRRGADLDQHIRASDRAIVELHVAS